MPLDTIGINFTAIQNMTAPDFDLKNNSADFLNDLPIKANEISGGWWGFIALAGLWTFLFWKLNQGQADGGDYGYDKARASGITSSICGIIGLYALNMGYFVNFFHVAIFIIITFISVGIVWKSGN